jgi:hypothetical protein
MDMDMTGMYIDLIVYWLEEYSPVYLVVKMLEGYSHDYPYGHGHDRHVHVPVMYWLEEYSSVYLVV